MQGFLSWHAYTGRVPAQVLSERLRANLLSASAGTVAGKAFSAQAFSRLLQQLNAQLAEYDDAIAAAVAEHPDTPIFASFPIARASCPRTVSSHRPGLVSRIRLFAVEGVGRGASLRGWGSRSPKA